MNVRGIYKTSLINFPGRISTVLFSGKCNMKCRYCHNPELVSNSSELKVYSEEEIIAFLKSRKTKVDAVVLSGGEPTLSPDLVSFLEKLRSVGLNIKIDTNGTNPQVTALLAEKKLIDYAAVDIKTSPLKYEELTGFSSFGRIAETVAALKAYGVDFELRTTCVPGFAEEEDFAEIGNAVGRVEKYFLQQFAPSANLIDKSFSRLEPYPPGHFQTVRNAVLAFSDQCGIRGI